MGAMTMPESLLASAFLPDSAHTAVLCMTLMMGCSAHQRRGRHPSPISRLDLMECKHAWRLAGSIQVMLPAPFDHFLHSECSHERMPVHYTSLLMHQPSAYRARVQCIEGCHTCCLTRTDRLLIYSLQLLTVHLKHSGPCIG